MWLRDHSVSDESTQYRLTRTFVVGKLHVTVLIVLDSNRRCHPSLLLIRLSSSSCYRSNVMNAISIILRSLGFLSFCYNAFCIVHYVFASFSVLSSTAHVCTYVADYDTTSRRSVELHHRKIPRRIPIIANTRGQHALWRNKSAAPCSPIVSAAG
jgi:hypothetical protein